MVGFVVSFQFLDTVTAFGDFESIYLLFLELDKKNVTFNPG